MINTLIFDLDGTLVDSLIDLCQTTNQVLKEYGFKTHELDSYKQFVGNGVDKLIERALPDDKKDLVKEARVRFDQIYLDNCLNNTKPYPGILELIEELDLRDYHLAVVTNKPKVNAIKIVKHLFGDKFTYIFGNTSFQPKKPNPCLTNLAIDLFGVNKNEVLYVGDSDVDIQTALNTKVKSIGCTWGFRGEQELKEAGANYIVSQASEIMEVIHDCDK